MRLSKLIEPIVETGLNYSQVKKQTKIYNDKCTIELEQNICRIKIKVEENCSIEICIICNFKPSLYIFNHINFINNSNGNLIPNKIKFAELQEIFDGYSKDISIDDLLKHIGEQDFFFYKLDLDGEFIYKGKDEYKYFTRNTLERYIKYLNEPTDGTYYIVEGNSKFEYKNQGVGELIFSQRRNIGQVFIDGLTIK